MTKMTKMGLKLSKLTLEAISLTLTFSFRKGLGRRVREVQAVSGVQKVCAEFTCLSNINQAHQLISLERHELTSLHLQDQLRHDSGGVQSDLVHGVHASNAGQNHRCCVPAAGHFLLVQRMVFEIAEDPSRSDERTAERHLMGMAVNNKTIDAQEYLHVLRHDQSADRLPTAAQRLEIAVYVLEEAAGRDQRELGLRRHTGPKCQADLRRQRADLTEFMVSAVVLVMIATSLNTRSPLVIALVILANLCVTESSFFFGALTVKNSTVYHYDINFKFTFPINIIPKTNVSVPFKLTTAHHKMKTKVRDAASSLTRSLREYFNRRPNSRSDFYIPNSKLMWFASDSFWNYYMYVPVEYDDHYLIRVEQLSFLLVERRWWAAFNFSFRRCIVVQSEKQSPALYMLPSSFLQAHPSYPSPFADLDFVLHYQKSLPNVAVRLLRRRITHLQSPFVDATFLKYNIVPQPPNQLKRRQRQAPWSEDSQFYETTIEDLTSDGQNEGIRFAGI